MAQVIGHISQIIGAVIDVAFDTEGKKAEEVLPKIFDALEITRPNGQKLIVPTMIGHTVAEAETMAAKDELRLEIIDSLYMPKQKPGMILDQSPKPGMGVKSGRRVFFVVNASRPRTDMIPFVTGYSLRQAKNMLETKGFEIEK